MILSDYTVLQKVDEPSSSVIKEVIEEEKEAEQHETSDGCGIDSREAAVKRKRMRIRGERMSTKAPIHVCLLFAIYDGF